MAEPVVKCLVLGCKNHSGAGTMVGPLCAPCDDMLRSGRVYPNKLTFIAIMQRQLDEARVACVKLQEALLPVRRG